MTYITSIKHYVSKRPGNEQVFLMAGFGGKIWQLRRLTNVLLRAGYDVTAVDYTKNVLSTGDPQMLLDLTEQVHQEAIKTLETYRKPVLLVGVSLGALMGVNILRRDERFKRAILITGGDIVKVAHRLYGKTIWPQPYDELAKIWRSVNMYTDPPLTDIQALMVLPTNDHLIDPQDVRDEVEAQAGAGGRFVLIERSQWEHVGTIIEETVVFPGRVLDYINQLDSNPNS